jgi:hypothetical protein
MQDAGSRILYLASCIRLQKPPPGVKFFPNLIHPRHPVEYGFLPPRKPESILDGFVAHEVEVRIETNRFSFLGRIFLQFLQSRGQIRGIDVRQWAHVIGVHGVIRNRRGNINVIFCEKIFGAPLDHVSSVIKRPNW